MILSEDLFDTIAETGDFEDFEQYADLATAQDSIPAVEAEVIPESEIQPEGPEQGLATGIANLIHDLVINANATIQQYNNAAANMEEYPELVKIMQNIASDEFTHIGQLEKALEVVSPNAANIEEGEVESEENLDPGSPVDEALTEDTEKKSNGKWVNKGAAGEHGEFKTKKEADAQRRAIFAGGYHESYDEFMESLGLDEALNISDDYRALRVIDKAIRDCDAAKELTVQQCDEIADAINVALHEISSDRKNSRK